MNRPNGPATFPQNSPYQQPHQMPRPFQQQQFGPRFQSPQPMTSPGSFYQPPQQHHDLSRPPYQNPGQHQPFFQPPNHPNFDPTSKPPFQTPIQHFGTPPPNQQYPPPPIGPGFNQPFRTPGSTYEPSIQNFNQPPPIQNFNQPPPVQNYNQPPPIQNFSQSPVQSFNNHPPIQNFNQPPPIQNYNSPVTPPFNPGHQNNHRPMNSPYQSPSQGYGPTTNTSHQPQVHSPDLLKQPNKLPVDQCYQQQPPSFISPRQDFNQRQRFRPPGQHRFSFMNQQPRFQSPQHGNNRFNFHPRQQYHNHNPLSTNKESMGKHVPKKDKLQIACDIDDCDFVGHASAVKEHQNMHHRLGLHKKVLYSNNSDAINKWIQERKKKWPTKETIQTKLEVEDEKIKRGERIVDEDFQRFNKNNKNNNSGSKRFNNRKRPRFNGEYVEPVEEPMNGNLKRFSGIVDVQKQDEIIEETGKPVALKLLEEYAESSSDDEPPDETAIVKESAPLNNTILTEPNDEPCSTSKVEDISMKCNDEVDSISLSVINDVKVENKELTNEKFSKVNGESIKPDFERGQKRKKSPKKEFKPVKKTPPLRTPRTEIVERKGALLEALMGDLMRSERNAITQCICYIRNNMHRFTKIQAA